MHYLTLCNIALYTAHSADCFYMGSSYSLGSPFSFPSISDHDFGIVEEVIA